MRRDSIESQLAALGIDPREAGEAISVTLNSGSSYGLALAEPTSSYTPLVDTTTSATAGDFDTLAATRLDEVGIAIRVSRRAPHVVEVSTPDGQPLTWTSKGSTPSAIASDPNEPSVVMLDARGAAPAWLRRPDGCGIAVLDDLAAPLLVPLHPLIPLMPPPPDLDIPLEAWLDEVSDDPWLHDTASRGARFTDVWHRVAVAGALARLHEQASPAAARTQFDGLLADGSSASGPRAWARSLAADQAAHVARLVEAEVEALDSNVAHLRRDFRPEDEDWKTLLRSTCLRRDDVESVRLLLLEAGRWDETASLLGALDARASRFVESFPFQVTLDDERLRRAALRDPDAWWACFAVGPA